MPYLVCDKCNGYYELQEGESIADFEGCECGGILRLVKSLNNYHNTENAKTVIQSFRENSKQFIEDNDSLEENQSMEITVGNVEGLDRLLSENKNSKRNALAKTRRQLFKEIALIPELYNVDYIELPNDHVQSQIREILAKILEHGQGKRDAIQEIMSETTLSYHEAENVSRHEINRIKNLGNWYICKEKGFSHFKVFKMPDTCELCHEAYDDKIFSIDQVEMLPPLHNLCTCTAMFYKK